jgi:hypothetical protein
MIDNPVWEICERVTEVQALLDDHIAGGKHTAADVVAKAQAVLSESALLRAMFDVGYFPPNTPPDEGASVNKRASEMKEAANRGGLFLLRPWLLLLLNY